jgi:hypothetical protein
VVTNLVIIRIIRAVISLVAVISPVIIMRKAATSLVVAISPVVATSLAAVTSCSLVVVLPSVPEVIVPVRPTMIPMLSTA